jgi:hypothetical protein
MKVDQSRDVNLTQKQNGRVERCYLGKSHESHLYRMIPNAAKNVLFIPHMAVIRKLLYHFKQLSTLPISTSLSKPAVRQF